MARVHILTQYVWPDAAPTGLYAEQLADRLIEHGCEVQLVGGTGGYRISQREKPIAPILTLNHYQGRRGSLRQTFTEYASVKRAFQEYIEASVKSGDVVIVTSAPPNTVTLAKAIRRRSARSIYWLQDYYPELVRGLWDYPKQLRMVFRRHWDKELLQWDQVVKIGANLGGPSQNSIIIRNWPTLSFDGVVAPEPRTAIYSGNLGYGHDVELLIAACEKLRAADYQITMHCDGRGVSKLPRWLRPQPFQNEPGRLRDDLVRHEVHLVAANPRITQAIFPSKIWNSLAARRRLIGTGFAGAMAHELEAARQAPFHRHVDQWVKLIAGPRSLHRSPNACELQTVLA